VEIEVIETEVPELGSGVPRSEDTLHLTQITSDLAVQLGMFSKDTGFPLEKFELGFAYEEALENAWADRINRLSNFDMVRPGEVELDGIYGSPDGISFPNGVTTLEEYKLTWYSMHSKKFLLDMPTWQWQTKGYCKMLNLTNCIFRVFWVNGDYRPPAPAYRAYSVKYTQEEIDQNWDNLKNHARDQGWL